MFDDESGRYQSLAANLLIIFLRMVEYKSYTVFLVFRFYGAPAGFKFV